MPDGCRGPGFAHVDVSTGEFRATEIDLADAAAALETLNVREVLVPAGSAQKLSLLEDRRGVVGLRRGLRRAQSVRSLPICCRSTAAAWKDVRWQRAPRRRCCIICARRSAARWIIWSRPRFTDRADALVLDATTVRNLGIGRAVVRRRVEGIDAAFSAGSHAHRHGRTSAAPAFARAIASKSAEIEARLDAVEELYRGDDLAERAGQESRRRFWIWSVCSRRSAWLARVRGMWRRWRDRWPWCRRLKKRLAEAKSRAAARYR